MEKSVSNAHGTGVDSYLFDSIFKSGGRLPHAATSLMDADRDRSYLREIAAFSWATPKQMQYCRRWAGLTMFMATGIWFVAVCRLANTREEKTVPSRHRSVAPRRRYEALYFQSRLSFRRDTAQSRR